LKLTNLTRRYGKLDAVNGLSLSVRPGRCYGFFGRNGAGKTTTIKCLLNLLKPTAGTVRVFGLDRNRTKCLSSPAFATCPMPWLSIPG